MLRTDQLCFTDFYFGKLSGPVSEELIYNSPDNPVVPFLGSHGFSLAWWNRRKEFQGKESN